MRRFPLVVLTLLALALAGCQASAQSDLSNAQVVVELRDYSVKPSVPTVRAGRVTIGIRNLAGMAHELTVLKTDTPADKIAIDAQTAKAKEDGRVGGTPGLLAGGRVTALTLELTPGNYVLVCNVAGHYQLGMYAALKVE